MPTNEPQALEQAVERVSSSAIAIVNELIPLQRQIEWSINTYPPGYIRQTLEDANVHVLSAIDVLSKVTK